MQSVGFVEPGLAMSGQVKDLAVALVDGVALLLDVLQVELLGADQRIGLKRVEITHKKAFETVAIFPYEVLHKG